MTSLLGLGALAMIGVDAVIGVRLLAIARRTRQLPEAMLGMAFLLLGGIGYPLTTAARRGALGSEEANAALMALGLLTQNVACFGMYLMTARTFRNGEGWARVLVWLAAAAFLASLVGQALTDGFAANVQSASYWVGLITRTLAFGWSAAESWRQHRLAVRRLRLGLVDPLVANRFLLFALGMGGVLCAFLAFIAGSLVSPNPADVPWVLALTGAAGIGSAVPTWFAFLPPAAYCRWIRERGGLVAPAPS